MPFHIVQTMISQHYLSGCTCPDYNALCKHIFLVSRVTKLPFTFKKDTIMSIGVTLYK
ncbi:hypothetical protein BDF21DRAFT_411387 [Thamnidium elegans]|nr:hypothetical protein BDF21DRAFT_411387 [Thamnidium elegans]